MKKTALIIILLLSSKLAVCQCILFSFTKEKTTYHVMLKNKCQKNVFYKVGLEALLKGKNEWYEVLENITYEKQIDSKVKMSSPYPQIRRNESISIYLRKHQIPAFYANCSDCQFRFIISIIDHSKKPDLTYMFSNNFKY